LGVVTTWTRIEDGYAYGKRVQVFGYFVKVETDEGRTVTTAFGLARKERA